MPHKHRAGLKRQLRRVRIRLTESSPHLLNVPSQEQSLPRAPHLRVSSIEQGYNLVPREYINLLLRTAKWRSYLVPSEEVNIQGTLTEHELGSNSDLDPILEAYHTHQSFWLNNNPEAYGKPPSVETIQEIELIDLTLDN